MNTKQIDFKQLTQQIKTWGQELGFQQLGISNIDLSQYEPKLKQWLANHYHGEMDYMSRHGSKRSRPAELVPNTVTIISARMDYFPANSHAISVLQDKSKAYISRYALGGDYHHFMRKRLQRLADRICEHVGEFGYRAFTDSAPVLERAIAEKAGLGRPGKNTMLIHRQAGSYFFLGELFTDLPLPTDDAHDEPDICGKCTACMHICPTQAIVAPYELDARRCISYLTIEYKGIIPEQFRPAMGNRIYGCDDCQLVCPWNRYAKASSEAQFQARHQLDSSDLLTLFNWSEQRFLKNTQGSAIRRIGYEYWRRNIAIALGNAPHDPEIIKALQHALTDASDLLAEHLHWAIAQQNAKQQIDDPLLQKLAKCKKMNPHY